MTLKELADKCQAMMAAHPELASLPVWFRHDWNVPLFQPVVTGVRVDRFRPDEKTPWRYCGTWVTDAGE
jgi:hypothetical protein